ncbi:unnamed protein product [Chilo suppressalis]|uniref:Aminopeptidase n=1 Tax=Chilo suppressalis TaxID=168631 RepID=A0ABN8BII0_CHISP|nr:unnamed protein product [Chilo suppressalis]
MKKKIDITKSLWKNKYFILLSILAFCLIIAVLALSARLNKVSANCDVTPAKTSPSMYASDRKTKIHELTHYRLPKHVIPLNYKLLLRPNMGNKTFSGKVNIKIHITEPTKNITIHSNKLDISSVKLKRKKREIIIASTIRTNDDREFFIIELGHEIEINNYELILVFTGRLDRGYVSFYQSTLKSGRTMVASKFEPTYARQAFPCFDEPDFKATYDISLVKPLSYVALSNMNAISSKVEDDRQFEIVTFATSVPMSTYLACFVICDFDFKQNEINSNGIGKNFILRSFSQKHQMHKIDFAQDIGKRATEFYIKYYEVPFPLPKLDMIAIPDYVSGATEHWGLITYRETSFLVDETTASSRNKINVANTVAHELAHMWFGNLVTMKWWDDLWLNEGFASYMQVKALNAIEPSWTMMDQFLIKTMHSVLVTDAKLSSHSIVQSVATPDEITAIFDSISYNKGASVLRMLEGFIGEENFRLGVSDYLKKYKYSNTITKDLLASLEPYFKKEYPNLSIFYIMDTWTRQMGYPLLTLSKGDQPNQYVVTQKRFLLDPEVTSTNDTDYKYRWFVPITYTSSNGTNRNIIWFPDTAENVVVTVGEAESWIKINNKQIGYYRVNYPLEMWQKLIEQLKAKSEQLTISDRSHLLDDAFALAEARVIPYDVALSLSSYLRVEEDYVPWETAARIFLSLSDKLTNSLSDNLNIYVQQLVKPLYEKQIWQKTNLGVIEGLLRTRILSLATRCQLPDAQAKVRTMFLNWLNSHGTENVLTIETDLRDFVYYYGMQSATQQEWEKLWNIYLEEEDAQEQTKLRHALAAPRDTTILRKYLTLAWDEKNIRSQDYLTVVGYISGNPSGTALVWDDVRTRWTELVGRFSLNSRYLGNLIPTVTSSFNTQLKLKEMEVFFDQYPEAGAGAASRRRALETVKNNIKWTDHNQASVLDFLKNHQQI